MASATLVIGTPSPPRVAGCLILRQAQDEVHSVGGCHEERVLMLSLSKHEGWSCKRSARRLNRWHHKSLRRDDEECAAVRASGRARGPAPRRRSLSACTAAASGRDRRRAPCSSPPG